MKVRNGFVSNSSSSSFLVHFGEPFDADKFTVSDEFMAELNSHLDDAYDDVDEFQKIEVKYWLFLKSLKNYVPNLEYRDLSMFTEDDIKILRENPINKSFPFVHFDIGNQSNDYWDIPYNLQTIDRIVETHGLGDLLFSNYKYSYENWHWGCNDKERMEDVQSKGKV